MPLKKKIRHFLRFLRLRLLLKEFLNIAFCDSSFLLTLSLPNYITLGVLQEVQRERRPFQEWSDTDKLFFKVVLRFCCKWNWDNINFLPHFLIEKYPGTKSFHSHICNRKEGLFSQHLCAFASHLQMNTDSQKWALNIADNFSWITGEFLLQRKRDLGSFHIHKNVVFDFVSVYIK